MPLQTQHDPRLKKTLKTRHISMLALGGVIGAGLFVGSSAVIATAGPGAFITYAIRGDRRTYHANARRNGRRAADDG